MPRAKRVCARPGCPSTATTSYCTQHQAEYEAKRGNSNQRGYGSKHQQLRKQWQPAVATGTVHCARCKQPIQPGTAWDMGHDDTDRTKYQGPEHAACNRAAGGRAAHPTR